MSAGPPCPICQLPMTRRRAAAARFDSCRPCRYRILAAEGQAEYRDRPAKTAESYWTSAKTRYFDTALRLLGDLSKGNDLTDIGGGVGHFNRLALDRGWDAYSFDVSEIAAAEAAGASGRRGPSRRCRTASSAPQPSGASSHTPEPRGRSSIPLTPCCAAGASSG